MRMLDQKKIDYQIFLYDNNDGKIDGVSVANKIGKDPKTVYKTLVTQGNSREIYVFVIPVADELDLKKAAKATGEKKVEMIPVKDILKWTGYIRGGCSPVGMKSNYQTFIDKRAGELDTIVVSGGRIGTQIEMKIEKLIEATVGKFEELIK